MAMLAHLQSHGVDAYGQAARFLLRRGQCFPYKRMKNRKPLQTQQQSKGFISPHVNQLGQNMRAGMPHCCFVCSLSSVSSQRQAGAGKAANYIQTMTGQTPLPSPCCASDCRSSSEQSLVLNHSICHTQFDVTLLVIIYSIHLSRLATIYSINMSVPSFPPRKLFSQGGKPPRSHDQFIKRQAIS